MSWKRKILSPSHRAAASGLTIASWEDDITGSAISSHFADLYKSPLRRCFFAPLR
jgi:hypothetical protein